MILLLSQTNFIKILIEGLPTASLTIVHYGVVYKTGKSTQNILLVLTVTVTERKEKHSEINNM